MKRTKSATYRRGVRRGAAVVEFALVVPLFFLLVFALIEFGRLVMVQQAVSNAAREGGRTAALTTTTDQSEVDTAIREVLRRVISDVDDADMQVQITPSDFAAVTSGTPITVALQVDFAQVSWLPGTLVFPDGGVVASSCTMERE